MFVTNHLVGLKLSQFEGELSAFMSEHFTDCRHSHPNIYLLIFVMTGLSFVFVQEILLDNSVLVGPSPLTPNFVEVCSAVLCIIFGCRCFPLYLCV